MIRTYIIIGTLVAAVAAGAFATRQYYVAKQQRAQIANLERTLAANRAAEAANQALFVQDQAVIRALEERINDVLSQVTDGECLPASDVDRLRSIFTNRPTPRGSR